MLLPWGMRLASQDLGFDNAGGLADLPQKLLNMDGQIHSLRGDGHHRAAVGGHDGVDGGDVGIDFRKQIQNGGKDTQIGRASCRERV